MILAVVLEKRFLVAADGSAWTLDAFARPYWNRYLTVFDEVHVIARAMPVEVPPSGALRVDGTGVRLRAVPPYIGPLQLVRRWRSVRAVLREELVRPEAVMLRVPGALANLAVSVLPRHRPFGVEVVGDPIDVFGEGMSHPLRRVFRWWFARCLREQCRHGAVVGYVTEKTLQERYPPSPWAFTTHYSSFDPDEDSFVEQPAPIRRTGPFRLVTVGSLEQPYKGVDVLLESLRRCRRAVDARLDVIGDGKNRPRLEALARRLGLEDSVVFHKTLSGPAAVRRLLRGADLFVIASRTEGLPRALIEAMALGLPCVGTSVGGIPELLSAEDLVRPNAPGDLAALMEEVLTDADRRAAMARRNLSKAQEFRPDVLDDRRRQAYQHLASAAAAFKSVPQA